MALRMASQNAENAMPGHFGGATHGSKGLKARSSQAPVKVFGSQGTRPAASRKALGDVSNRRAFGDITNAGGKGKSGLRIFSDTKATAKAKKKSRSRAVEEPEYMAPRGPESPDHTEDIREMDMHFANLMRPDPLFGLMGARKAGVKKVPKMTFDIEHDEQLSASEDEAGVDPFATGVAVADVLSDADFFLEIREEDLEP